MYEQIINNDTVCRVFESVEEMVEAGRALPYNRVRAHDRVRKSEWIGRKLKGWDGVYGALRSAWDDGLSILDGMLRDLESSDLPKPESRRRKPRFSEDNGDELDYDRLRSGRDYWRSSRRQNTRGPATITLLVDVCAPANVKARNILWRGAAAIALAKLLEDAGYRVELWAFDRCNGRYRQSGHSYNGFHAVCLKRASEPLDVSTLINIVSGWAFRTMWFRAACLGEMEVDQGHGWHNPNPERAELDLCSSDQNRIVIHEVWDRDAAVNLIRDTLRKITAG
jgi:hypothetical protein